VLEALLALIAVVMVGRLLVADQAFVPSELVALVLLLPVIVFTDRLTPGPRNALLLASILIVFLSYRLAPFRFADSATAFDFWPFLVWFNAGVRTTLAVTDWSFLFGQVFLCAALLWAIKRCGASVVFAASVTVAAVVATEIAQLWLPGHTGSLTDIALAVTVALSFYYVDRRARRARVLARATPRFGRNP